VSDSLNRRFLFPSEMTAPEVKKYPPLTEGGYGDFYGKPIQTHRRRMEIDTTDDSTVARTR
jgi:hypothetical protein